MIASGRAEVKFAIPIGKGTFHDKFGLINSGIEKILFTGSVNETKGGLEENYESISVDLSWDKSKNVQRRIEENDKRFDRIWNNEEKGLSVKDATDLVYEEIAKYQERSTIKAVPASTSSEQPLDNFKGVYFRMASEDTVVRDDYSDIEIISNDRKLAYDRSDLSIYFEEDNVHIKSDTSYKSIERIIDVTKHRCDRKKLEVKVSQGVIEYLARSRYSISQYQILGRVLKDDTKEFRSLKGKEFESFSQIVQSEVVRPLKLLHLRAAYYEYRMARAANFSVPGAGKTAMILGVFAYLNSRKFKGSSERVDRILVISPINAFGSWISEFEKVFDYKKELSVIDSQTSKDFENSLNISWKTSNLVLVNYEALQNYSNILQRLIDSHTMLVFDEVHRIKNPIGQRAKYALTLAKSAQFRFVMTGTPIPNSYRDIYNFLHILYGSEYESFFGWSSAELFSPSVRKMKEINYKLEPFFWRVNKDDLGVPAAEADKQYVVNPSAIQLDLAESIYYNEKSSLARLIRLIQASTNPELLGEKISYSQMGFSNEGDTAEITETEFDEKLSEPSETVIKDAKSYEEYNLGEMESPKFEKGIELVEKLVSENKKVIVWAIFVDTMKKIQGRLIHDGVNTNLVYGGVSSIEERQKLIDDFKYGRTPVMVSNPQTLGESLSLHESVHDAVYFEYNFNLTFMLQSRDRIHRLGLKNNQYTRYYYLETRSEDESSGRPGFIDQNIYERLKDKEKIMQNAIDRNTLGVEYSDDEIADAIKIIDLERSRIKHNS